MTSGSVQWDLIVYAIVIAIPCLVIGWVSNSLTYHGRRDRARIKYERRQNKATQQFIQGQIAISQRDMAMDVEKALTGEANPYPWLSPRRTWGGAWEAMLEVIKEDRRRVIKQGSGTK